MDKGGESLEQILSKDVSKSQLGETELTTFKNVTIDRHEYQIFKKI